MKRFFAALLAVCLTLTGFAFAEESQAAALPAVGDVVEGFEVIELKEFPLIDATIVRFEHQATGAELFYIANDDTNRVFDLTFLTDTVDQTGLPHVFEHSTLDGSEKYPSKSLFFNLVYQTYNTYMNAYTTIDHTGYPVASLSEKQLLAYADYYTDSCLHPMIMEDESIFREEAWRYRMESEDAPLTIEGTVYSEMLGSYNLSSAAYKNALSATFPGSWVGNVHGGQPDYIPDMTWDALKEYHNLYYHPSNCVGYLYGEFEDYTAFLKLLDGYFSEYEKREFTHEDAGYTPLTESIETVYPFPVEAASTSLSDVFYMIVCPGIDDEQAMVLNTMTDLLAASGSPLSQKIAKVLPGGSYSCFVEDDSPDFAVVFYIQHVNESDAQLFRDTVDEAIAEIAENGFDQELVDSTLASLALDIRLIREASDVGVENIIPSLVTSYVATGNPWNYIDYVDALGKLDEYNAEGLYQKTASDWLTGEERITTLVTTVPQPGLKEEKDAALAEKLADVKAKMTPEEIAQIVASSNAEDEADDSAQYVAQLQAVTVASLPEEAAEYETYDETDDDGVRHIDVVAGVDGIGQASVLLDAAGLSQEDIHWFKLYVDLVGDLDTAHHTRGEIANLSSRYLYDGTVRVSLPGAGDNYHPYLRLGWTSTDEDLEKGYDLMYEIVFESDVTDTARLSELVKGVANGLKSSITQDPYSVGLYRILSRTSKLYGYFSYANYLDYYTFLTEVEQELNDDPAAVTEKLESIKAYFNNRMGAVMLYAGNEESIELNRELGDKFLARLDKSEITPVDYEFPIPAQSEALVVDSNVQYNIIAADYASLGLENFDGGMDALTALVSDQILYPLLRDQYGAYGVMHYAMADDGIYIVSYRDPNVAETYAVYAQLPELVAGLDVDQETLDGYILSSYAQYAMPAGELAGAYSVAIDSVVPTDGQDVLDTMRSLKTVTPDTIHEYAELYGKLLENGSIFTAGGAGAINQNADMFEAILNPFGSVDASEIEFSDLPEDSEDYAVVRDMFESGLMAPVSETEFGVNETASVGDLVAPFYVIVGGTLDVDEAQAFFAEYGLVEADADMAEPLTGAKAAELTANFSALIGMSWSDDSYTDEEMTRADVAWFLNDYFEFLNEE